VRHSSSRPASTLRTPSLQSTRPALAPAPLLKWLAMQMQLLQLPPAQQTQKAKHHHQLPTQRQARRGTRATPMTKLAMQMTQQTSRRLQRQLTAARRLCHSCACSSPW
jgi:hypothetical protein